MKGFTLEEKLLWLYVALMPFAEVFHFALGAKRVSFVDFIAATLIGVWAVKRLNGKVQFVKTSMEFPLILMICLFLPSFINSTDIFDSIIETGGLIYLTVLFIVTANIVSDHQRLIRFLKVLLITGALTVSIGLFQFFRALITGEMGTGSFLFYTKLESMAHHLPRISLAFESPNMALAYLHVILIAGMLLLLLDKHRRDRLFAGLCMILVFVAAFLAASRRFAGLLLSLFMVMTWFGKAKILKVLKYAVLVGFIIFFIASVATTIWVVFPIEISKDASGDVSGLKADFSYSMHLIQPVASINMFKKHPVLGVGFGSYNKNFRDNVDWQWLRSSFGFGPYPQFVSQVENKTLTFDPHSVFLGALAETGIIGFAGLIYFFSTCLILFVRGFRAHNATIASKAISGCILAGFIGFLLNGLTLDILSMRHFWIMLAIGAARANKPELDEGVCR